MKNRKVVEQNWSVQPLERPLTNNPSTVCADEALCGNIAGAIVREMSWHQQIHLSRHGSHLFLRFVSKLAQDHGGSGKIHHHLWHIVWHGQSVVSQSAEDLNAILSIRSPVELLVLPLDFVGKSILHQVGVGICSVENEAERLIAITTAVQPPRVDAYVVALGVHQLQINEPCLCGRVWLCLAGLLNPCGNVCKGEHLLPNPLRSNRTILSDPLVCAGGVAIMLCRISATHPMLVSLVCVGSSDLDRKPALIYRAMVDNPAVLGLVIALLDADAKVPCRVLDVGLGCLQRAPYLALNVLQKVRLLKHCK